jgi:hypothetical protein
MICFAMMIAMHNWLAAWFAASATYFAFVCIAGKPNAHADGSVSDTVRRDVWQEVTP